MASEGVAWLRGPLPSSLQDARALLAGTHKEEPDDKKEISGTPGSSHPAEGEGCQTPVPDREAKQDMAVRSRARRQKGN